MRHNVETLRRARGRRGLGRREGGRLRARRGGGRAGRARGGRGRARVATVPEALALAPHSSPTRASLVMGPREPRARPGARRAARAHGRDGTVPAGVPVHLKLDTGMGRWGLGRAARPGPRRRRAHEPPRAGRLRRRLHGGADRALPRATEPSRTCRATSPTAPARCASPLRASTPLAAASRSTGSPRSAPTPPPTGSAGVALGAGSRASRGCARARARATAGAFVAEAPTWIGIVPVGYADGFRRDMTGTEVLVAGRTAPRRRNDLDGRLRRRARQRAPGRARR